MITIRCMNKLQFLPERLQEQMDQRKIEVGTLAYLSGVSANMIYKLLGGERPNVSAKLVAKLAKAAGCSSDYLTGLTDYPRPYKEDGKLFSSEEAEEVASFVENMRPERRQDVLAIVRALEEHDQRMVGTQIRYDRLLAQAKLVYGEEYVLQVIANLARGVDDAAAGSSVSQE